MSRADRSWVGSAEKLLSSAPTDLDSKRSDNSELIRAVNPRSRATAAATYEVSPHLVGLASLTLPSQGAAPR